MSFRLLETGGGQARHVSLRGRVRAGVLTGDWCFRRRPAAQTFSYSASGLRHRDWHVEKADCELSFVGNRRRAGEARVFAWLVCDGKCTFCIVALIWCTLFAFCPHAARKLHHSGYLDICPGQLVLLSWAVSARLPN